MLICEGPFFAIGGDAWCRSSLSTVPTAEGGSFSCPQLVLQEALAVVGPAGLLAHGQVSLVLEEFQELLL